MPVPRVFISYSHDSDPHKNWVLQLATRLRQDYGIDVILDQWDVALGDDLPKFMESVVKTDRVLMICSENYVQKCNEGQKGGVPMEKRLMSGQLMQGRPINTFIPVMRDNNSNVIPDFIGGGSYYIDFKDNNSFDKNVFELAASIHNAKAKKPPIGRNPFKKGLDATFGLNGIKIFSALDLHGIRVIHQKGFFYITTILDKKTCVLRVSENGVIDDNFGQDGLILFSKLTTSNDYGLDLYDFYFKDERIYQINPNSNGSVLSTVISQFQEVEELYSGKEINVVMHENRNTRQFKIDSKHVNILILNSADENSDNKSIFETSSDLVKFRYARAKIFGEHLYLYGRTNSSNKSLGIQRFNLNGVLDDKFGNEGLVTLEGGALFSHHIFDLVEMSGGNIVAVGSGNEAAVACLKQNGQLDTNFGNEGYLQFRAACRSEGRFVFEHNNNIVICGIEYDGNSIFNCYVALLQKDGRVDTEFAMDGSVSIRTGSQDELIDAILEDGKIILLFQHDKGASIRPRVGLTRVHLN